MTARDSLAARLEQAISYECGHTEAPDPSVASGCRDCRGLAEQAADVALAWMAENGWVQGREEWGLCDGEAVFKLDPDTEGMARRIAAADNSLSIIRRINATTDWEEVK